MNFLISRKNSRIERPAAYGVISKSLHWSMAVLVVFSLCAIEFNDLLPKGPVRHEVIGWHFQAGLCVLILIFVRILWRMKHPAPRIFPPLSRMQKLLSAAAHVSLYVMMLILPIFGILAKQSKGNVVKFFGHAVPTLLDEDRGLPYAMLLKSAHVYMGNVLIGLVAVHVMIALFHHMIRRDNTLTRMMP